MLIQSVHIERFRCIENESLVCDPLTILVGPNGAGKSTWLQALQSFYDVNARMTQEDFYGRVTDDPVVIRVTYGDLRPEELKEFKAYLQGDTLTVTKRIKIVDGRVEQKYFGASHQFAPFATIRAMKGKRDQLAEWNNLVESGALPGAEKARQGVDLDTLMHNFETANPKLLEPVEREEQFFGPRNVGGGKLDNFTKYVYLPAVRDVADDMGDGKNTTLYQLLDALIMRKLQSRPEVQEFKTDFGQKLKEIFQPEKIAELATLASAITTTLSDFVPGAAFGLKFGDVKLPDIPTPPAIASLTEDDFAGDITRKGHGLQRALIFTLFQHLAVVQRDEASGPVQVTLYEDGKAVDGGLPSGPDLILAIEEPELYQHPQRCRYLAELLMQLSQDPKRGLGSRNQVIYTTHSSYFVSLDRFSSIRLSRKAAGTAERPARATLASFSLSDAAKQMAAITQGKPEDFTADRFRVRAYPVMTPVVSEGFFARAVVVVEGMTEAGALWRVSELLGDEWTRRGVVLVPAGGKNNIDRPVVIFRGLKIPAYFLFDGDVSKKGKQAEEGEVRTNRNYQRLAGATDVVDFPPMTITATWACFHDCFETYCKKAVGDKDFEECRADAAAEFGYDEPADALKNFDVAASFVSRLYERGKKLAEIEDIIRRISAMA
ncbi:MAG: ATP-dependent endonuclease [Candidatus Rokubacteria bacterium]|nr:ATP-dependent endonuclease [Candidatus Rokubacteria bacterium]